MTLRRAYHWYRVASSLALLFVAGAVEDTLRDARRARRNGVLR